MLPMGNNGFVKAKEPRISVRVDSSLKQRIESAVQRTGVDEATMVRNCIEALCDHIERHGHITFPLSLNDNHMVPVRYPKSAPSAQVMHDKPTTKGKKT